MIFPIRRYFFGLYQRFSAIATDVLHGNRATRAWPIQNSKMILRAVVFFLSQMIMSYLYFASVLYLAVHPYKGDIKWRIISRSSNSTRDYGSRSQRVVWWLDKVNLAVHTQRLCDVCHTWGVGAERRLENSFPEKIFHLHIWDNRWDCFARGGSFHKIHLSTTLHKLLFHFFKRERMTQHRRSFPYLFQQKQPTNHFICHKF